MENAWTDFCEQINPAVLNQKQLSSFRDAARFQQSFLANTEKRVLLWIATKIPESINSDHLTALGFAGQIAAGVAYALSRWNHWWLMGVIACLAINWLGDSLDGTVARLRQKQRPRYGFYVDHMIDSIGALALMAGLAFSGYMHPYIAIGLLIAFLLLSIQSYLATYTLGEFQLSFWNFGPTELRLLLSIGNLALLRWPTVLKVHYRLFDIGGIIGLLGMSAMLIFSFGRNTYRLYMEERLP
ncbi:MAG TPA: CDP-alcohol phosphatidyltransferase family protein [Terriglobales bacterium]|nr:CDP-alcohol phosphatidyltransferase family protein [Terriglobales bacterium]